MKNHNESNNDNNSTFNNGANHTFSNINQVRDSISSTDSSNLNNNLKKPKGNEKQTEEMK